MWSLFTFTLPELAEEFALAVADAVLEPVLAFADLFVGVDIKTFVFWTF